MRAVLLIISLLVIFSFPAIWAAYGWMTAFAILGLWLVVGNLIQGALE